MHTKVKSSTMGPRSQDTFTSVNGPQLLSTNFCLQPLSLAFQSTILTHCLRIRVHEWAKRYPKRPTHLQGWQKLKMIGGTENIIMKVIREHALPGRTFWQTILSEMPILCISGNNFKFLSLIVYVSLLINVLRGKICKCREKKSISQN